MIRYTMEKKDADTLIRMLSFHDQIAVSDGTEDLFIMRVKPARRGEGNGRSKGKPPIYEERVAVKGTNALKGRVCAIRRTIV